MSEIFESNQQPPTNLQDLAAWFAEAVREELAALEKDGGSQIYEVHSGKLIESKRPNQGIMVFLIADGTRIPEDASGRLKTTDSEFTITVVGQQGNILHLNVEGKVLPESIHFAKLIIDDTALLRRLVEVLEKCSENAKNISPLAISVFHPSMANIQKGELPYTFEFVEISGELRDVLEQACGSTITYIWGPPGTGKTYAIAHLVTALIESGERVLVTSHTHAAVDQALFEAVKVEQDKKGPLSNHSSVADGRVLRIGATTNKKIPPSVRFDEVLEMKGQGIQEEILEVQRQIIPISKIIDWAKSALEEWNKLKEFKDNLNRIKESLRKTNLFQTKVEKAINISKNIIDQRVDELEKAKLAWFWRESKTRKAQLALEKSKSSLQEEEKKLSNTLDGKEKLLRLSSRLEQTLVEQQDLCEKLPDPELIKRELAKKTDEIKPLQEKLLTLQEKLSNLAQVILNNASAIFCTLTKNYVGKDLEGQKFDAVIVDEISMALPPLIFLAACRARSRVILVGDFLQLPPIVKSDTEITNAILGTDTFHLSGVAVDLKPSKNCLVLARLTKQHRMVPKIADVARCLVYNQAGGLNDDESVKLRNVEEKNPWLDFLPKNPLIIVDTADLYCWSGKQPGSLSRFNMYSAMLSVEIAAIAARKITKPSENGSQPIGIIAPYAAQRRLLSKLVSDMELDQWVAAGTVHTFQGNQADLVIFDSVLDEPYYAARLSNPKEKVKNVLRDLNVAVTRAKNKFIFVGSSEWLNKHAKPASALGHLWSYLKGQADLLPALDFVGNEFKNNIASISTVLDAWDVPKDDTIQVFDETTFFDYFAKDINAAKKSIFALAPYFGEYRWPKIHPLFSAALSRNIEITIVTPPLTEAQNKNYTEKVIMNLRALGAIVVTASGIHGKDIIIDEKIVYTGSMNWSSHRGRIEVMHRISAPKYAKQYLEFLQAKHIRQSSTNEDGTTRLCPKCGWPLQVVNQRKQQRWDFQAMKIGCTNPNCEGYLRDINERPPYKHVPVCQIDGRTKYRRVRRGRGEIWQCPKHPKECERFKVVEGDP
jgi:hypothetical protein